MYITDMLGDGGAYESISPGNTATGLTESKRVPTSGVNKGRSAVGALIVIEDNNVRACWDGTTPTNANGTSADDGLLLRTGQNIELRSQNNLNNFLVIDAVSGSTGNIKVLYYF